MSDFCPKMTDANLPPISKVEVIDEYQNVRELCIAEERALTLYIDGFEIVTLMTLGQNPELLALGYIKNQGLIDDLSSIVSVQVDWDVRAVAVTSIFEREDWVKKLGSKIVTTGCGQGTVYANMVSNLQVLPSIEPLKQTDLYALLKTLGRYNKVYTQAGAVHSCALCDHRKPVFFIEDIGRHNAVDIITGKMWLNDIFGSNKLFYTTGRLTSEMVIKVAKMQVSILISRSGISNMALKLARDLGIMLISRANQQHFLIYHKHERMVFDAKLPKKLFVSGMKAK